MSGADSGQGGDTSTGFGALGNTLTGGIQDISALLPLLGTEQCETHIGSALSEGWLYVAATPMSIFGSLGMARAGFKALVAGWTSLRILGSRKLKDTGFQPTGTNLSLIMLNEDENKDQHLAETRLHAMLGDLHIEDARTLKLTSNCGSWNFYMFLSTAFFCFLALTPYIHLNIQASKEHAKLPVSIRWLLPSFRVFGGFLTATMIQIVIQRRLVTIIKSRLIFMALDRQVKDIKLDRHPEVLWHPGAASEACLWSLQQFFSDRKASEKQSWWKLWGGKREEKKEEQKEKEVEAQEEKKDAASIKSKASDVSNKSGSKVAPPPSPHSPSPSSPHADTFDRAPSIESQGRTGDGGSLRDLVQYPSSNRIFRKGALAALATTRRRRHSGESTHSISPSNIPLPESPPTETSSVKGSVKENPDEQTTPIQTSTIEAGGETKSNQEAEPVTVEAPSSPPKSLQDEDKASVKSKHDTITLPATAGLTVEGDSGAKAERATLASVKPKAWINKLKFWRKWRWRKKPTPGLAPQVEPEYNEEALAKLEKELEESLQVHFPPFDPTSRIPLPILSFLNSYGIHLRIPIYWPSQILLAFGILASVVGYLGCFTVVQSVKNNAAPAIWLGLEAALSIIRMFIWAANPEGDSAPRLQFRLQLAAFPPLPTCNKYEETIKAEQTLPLIRAKEFLQEVTAYAGLLDRFDSQDVSIFYTLTRTRDLTRVLYITLFDYKERTTRIYTRENGEPVIYTGTPVEIDLEHDIIQTKMTDQTVDQKVDPIAGDIDLMTALSEHYQSIMKKLDLREKTSSMEEIIKITWDLSEHTRAEPEVAAGPLELPEKTLADDISYLEEGEHQDDRRSLSTQRGEQISQCMTIVTRSFNYELETSVQDVTKEEAEEAIYLLIIEWRWIEWLCAVEAGRCENVLQENYNAMVTQVNQRRRQDLSPDAPKVGDELTEWMKHEWAKHARIRLTQDKEKALARLKAAADSLDVDFVSASKQDIDSKMVDRLWADATKAIKEMWENNIGSENRDRIVGISTDEDLEEATRKLETAERSFMEYLVRSFSDPNDHILEEKMRELQELDNRVGEMRRRKEENEKGGLVGELDNGENEAKAWLDDHMNGADRLARNKDTNTKAREITRKVSLARCQQIFTRLKAELHDIMESYDLERWKGFVVSSRVAELTHTNSPLLVVSREMAFEVGISAMARAISRIKGAIFLELDYFEEDDDFILAELLHKMQWGDLSILGSIIFYRTTLGPLTTAALLQTLKSNPKIISITGQTSPLGDEIVAALAVNNNLARQVTSPPFIAFEECVAYIDRVPIILMLRDNSAVRVDFFGPRDGNLCLGLAHRNDQRESTLRIETGNRKPLQKSVHGGTVFTNDNAVLLPGVHFDAGFRNTVYIRTEDTNHEIRFVHLLDEYGSPYNAGSDSWSTDKLASCSSPRRRYLTTLCLDI